MYSTAFHQMLFIVIKQKTHFNTFHLHVKHFMHVQSEKKITINIKTMCRSCNIGGLRRWSVKFGPLQENKDTLYIGQGQRFSLATSHLLNP